MSRPSKKRKRDEREAKRSDRQADRYANKALDALAHALQTFVYVVCEGCGMEQGQYDEGQPRPCAFCGHGLARYHAESEALKATFRPLTL